MPETGLEPALPRELAPKASVSTNFTTPAGWYHDDTMPNTSAEVSDIVSSFEAWAGIEPAHGGFADRSVTTSPPRLDTNTH